MNWALHCLLSNSLSVFELEIERFCSRSWLFSVEQTLQINNQVARSQTQCVGVVQRLYGGAVSRGTWKRAACSTRHWRRFFLGMSRYRRIFAKSSFGTESYSTERPLFWCYSCDEMPPTGIIVNSNCFSLSRRSWWHRHTGIACSSAGFWQKVFLWNRGWALACVCVPSASTSISLAPPEKDSRWLTDCWDHHLLVEADHTEN